MPFALETSRLKATIWSSVMWTFSFILSISSLTLQLVPCLFFVRVNSRVEVAATSSDAVEIEVWSWNENFEESSFNKSIINEYSVYFCSKKKPSELLTCHHCFEWPGRSMVYKAKVIETACRGSEDVWLSFFRLFVFVLNAIVFISTSCGRCFPHLMSKRGIQAIRSSEICKQVASQLTPSLLGQLHRHFRSQKTADYMLEMLIKPILFFFCYYPLSFAFFVDMKLFFLIDERRAGSNSCNEESF